MPGRRSAGACSLAHSQEGSKRERLRKSLDGIYYRGCSRKWRRRAVAASTATPEKKGKASGGRDDGKRTGRRADSPVAGDDSVVREGYPALKSERQKPRGREKWIGKKGGKKEKNGGRKKNKTGKRVEQEKHRGNYFHNGVVYNVRARRREISRRG